MFEEELRLEVFLDGGFTRRICPSCSMGFWSRDPDMIYCQDAPCVEYQFIGSPITRKPFSKVDMREAFLSYFENLGDRPHTRLPRYPVVARWREDIYLTIASIAAFQPHVTTGLTPPPANPLTISQPCIRMVDLDNVGLSGRHLTVFEMMAHHAFNEGDDQIYWREETVQYCDDFLTKVMGVQPEMISYKENPWYGGGNAGAAFEVLAGGAEVATLVFMNLEEDAGGSTMIDGKSYSEMPRSIVDTGYGLERLAWVSQGTPSVYDAIYGPVIDLLKENSEKAAILADPDAEAVVGELSKVCGLFDLSGMANLDHLKRELLERLATRGHELSRSRLDAFLGPMQAVYTIPDHLQSILFMIADGIVPSNVKAGYLARLLIRRLLMKLNSLETDLTINDLVTKQIKLNPDYPEMQRSREALWKILDLEAERFDKTTTKGRRLIADYLKKKKLQEVPAEKFVDFYDTHGIHPSMVTSIARDLELPARVPDNFWGMVAERHTEAEKKLKEEAHQELEKLPPTRLLYYEDSYLFKMDASVLYAKDKMLVLDRTVFYPEGGGQPADHGTLSNDTKTVEVVDTQKFGDIVVHYVDGSNFEVGDMVSGEISAKRRWAHMRHHTGTHIVGGAAKKVLGDHIWQTGAQKDVLMGRLDVTHFKRITNEQITEIERLANDITMNSTQIRKKEYDRNEADTKFGFTLYQGGAPKGAKIRVVKIGDHDTQACGGTHLDSAGDVGPIKIWRTDRIQDGVERLYYSCGPEAIKHIQENDRLLKEASQVLRVEPEQLPATAKRFFNEWKDLKKQIETLERENALMSARVLLNDGKDIETPDGTIRLVVETSARNMDSLVVLANQLIADPEYRLVAVLVSSDHDVPGLVVATTPASGVVARDLFKIAGEPLGAKGGGKDRLARGKVENPDAADDALEMVEEWLKISRRDA